MVGRVAASAIASASRSSFFCALSRVEGGRSDALKRAPFPLPAHQTGRAVFPHPAFRLASSSGFIIKHTAATRDARDKGAAHPVPRRHAREKTVSCRALAPYDFRAGIRALGHRHVRQRPDTPMRERHGRSKQPNRPRGGSVEFAPSATRSCCPASADR